LSALAQRYATALAGVAFEHKDVEKIRKDLVDFVRLLDACPDLLKVLSNPAVMAGAKKSVMKEIAARMDMHQEVRNFIFILIDRGRTPIASEIQQAFEAEMNRRLGIVEAIVASAHELSTTEKTQLAQSLEEVTGKRVQARFELNPELIAGVTVRIGSTIYDGSVREQLNRMRAVLELQMGRTNGDNQSG